MAKVATERNECSAHDSICHDLVVMRLQEEENNPRCKNEVPFLSDSMSAEGVE